MLFVVKFISSDKISSFVLLNNRYKQVFGKIPILGMIHLAGENPVHRALEELAIFEEEGVDGAIIENYHGSTDDVIATLKETMKRISPVVIGLNILPNEFRQSFPLADQYGADFIQLDHVAGNYVSGRLNVNAYESFKDKYPDIIVLGGVWPKYYQPMFGSDLRRDLKSGMKRAEAIVVTGAGTGKETPYEKIIEFRGVIEDHPLVIGAGLTPDNAYDQLFIADGAIVGSTFKVKDNTNNPIDRLRVRTFMSVVKEVRENTKYR